MRHLAAVLTALCLASSTLANVQVQGTARAALVPDAATLSYSVGGSSLDSRAAAEAASAASLDKLRAALKGLGVADADVAADPPASFSVTCSLTVPAGAPDGTAQVVDVQQWKAPRLVTVTLRDLTKLAQAQALAAGPVYLAAPKPFVTDPRPALDAARKAAMADALARAQLYAAAAGVTLGAVLQVTESPPSADPALIVVTVVYGQK